MDVSSIKIVPGKALAISVSGTEYLQRSRMAGVLPGGLATSQFEEDAAAGRLTPAQALSRVPAEIVTAIENALNHADPKASLAGYSDNRGWMSAQGTFFSLIA